MIKKTLLRTLLKRYNKLKYTKPKPLKMRYVKEKASSPWSQKIKRVLQPHLKRKSVNKFRKEWGEY